MAEPLPALNDGVFEGHAGMRKMKYGLAICASLGPLALSCPAAAAHWIMIDGTDQRWWIDTDTISPDKEKGITFFSEAMSEQGAVPPDAERVQDGIGIVVEAINCTTAEQFIYRAGDGDDGRWSKDMNTWPPAYWASVHHIVCDR
jgi:hypothetical protein